ncbi:uncharacterized protein si:ch73-204p21.2 [Labrus bergylta]|uniref:uncharacterized protein si:ch73-204p21.2 n=1 Tax=Labrus bergylta TaxID=56723 RepID=UPI0033141278
MAAVGADVTASQFFLPSGVVSFFILLLLLSIFLTALCSDCGRRSFELREPEDKNPSALIRVVKLEEAMVARENPMINEIQKDEKEFKSVEENTVSFSALRSQMGAPQRNHYDVQTNGSTAVVKTTRGSESAGDTEEEISVEFTPWRHHLRAPESQEVNSSDLSDSAHIYNTIGGGRSSGGGGGGDADTSSPATNHKPQEQLDYVGSAVIVDVKSVYARISRPVRVTTSTEQTADQVQVKEREEESSPPLPDRKV